MDHSDSALKQLSIPDLHSQANPGFKDTRNTDWQSYESKQAYQEDPILEFVPLPVESDPYFHIVKHASNNPHSSKMNKNSLRQNSRKMARSLTPKP